MSNGKGSGARSSRGKGDAKRRQEAYREGYDAIDWGKGKKTETEPRQTKRIPPTPEATS